MVVDASVLIALLYDEPGAAGVLAFLTSRADLAIAAPTLLEASVVYGSQKGFEADHVAELIERLGIEVVDFTAEHATEARLAYARFGRGRHPARLNFGDCIAYAVARVAGRPLAFLGDDFGQTDLEVVDLGGLGRAGPEEEA